MKSGTFIIAGLFLLIQIVANGQGTVSALEAQLTTVEGKAKADILIQLSNQLKQSAPEKAADYAEEALKISQKTNYHSGLIQSAYFIGIYERDERNFRKARLTTKKGLEAAQTINDQNAEMKGWEILQTIYQVSGNDKKAEEATLEFKRIKNSLDLKKRNQQLSVLKNTVQSKEKALQQSAEENEKIQEELEKTQEEKLIEEAKRARLAQEKAELAQEKAELAREKAELAKEKAELEVEAIINKNRLRRQRTIQIVLAFGFVIALIFAVLIAQYFRLKRMREEEQAKSQRQLMMQQKMATLGQLTAGIAHEIQNPLNFVNNFAEGSSEMASELAEALSIYQKKPNQKELEIAKEIASDLQQNATDIVANGQRISRIVRSMMEHARGNKGKIEQIDINDLIKRNLYLAYHGYRGIHANFKATIQENYDPNLKSLEVIAQDIDRVFLNVFGNACYALHQKKQLMPDFIPELKVTTQLKDKEALIIVRDNGPGISKSIRSRIFTPFFSTKPVEEGHTGLGLSISYDIIVQGHHGKLDVKSEPGHFTEFHIILPA